MNTTLLPQTQRLLNWYDQNHRDLPWRHVPLDPYKTWVSEIMLQQTRVETVIPLFIGFIDRFPHVKALAEAPLDDVLVMWQGLGYYSRARRLWEAANTVVRDNGGKLPRKAKEWEALPGIGPYTASAIASIVFNEPVVALDGNLLRVGSRLFGYDGDITKARSKKDLEKYLARWLPEERPGDFNQALMDLGASICLPQKPRCSQCPLTEWCQARADGIEGNLPVRGPRTKPKHMRVMVFLVQTPTHILLRQRSYGGFLQGMWEMPWFEQAKESTPEAASLVAESNTTAADALRAALRLSLPEEIKETEYLFSHRHWLMTIFVHTLNDSENRRMPQAHPDTEYRWHPKSQLKQAALPSVFERLLPPDLRTRDR